MNCTSENVWEVWEKKEIDSLIQWLPEEVLIDTLEIGDKCLVKGWKRVPDRVFFGKWSREPGYAHFFTLDEPIEIAEDTEPIMVDYEGMEKDGKTITGWFSCTRGRYMTVAGPY
jgi:hypothetical protein